MKRWLFFIYGVTCHVAFLAIYVWLCCFVGGFLVPRTIDTPGEGTPGARLSINLLLLALFAAQHSIMARPAFKCIWTRLVPTPIERTTYVFASCVVTVLMMLEWQGMECVVWDVQTRELRALLWTLFGAGWLLVPAVTFLLNHFDLFGTRQVWLHLRGQEYQPLPFRVPVLYKRVRHPLYLGWGLAFWAIPTMTVGHLLFAGVMTGYMALAALVEERDLLAHFGRPYEEYRRRVPMFVPRLRSATSERITTVDVENRATV